MNKKQETYSNEMKKKNKSKQKFKKTTIMKNPTPFITPLNTFESLMPLSCVISSHKRIKQSWKEQASI